MDPYQVTFQTWNKVAALYQEKFMDLHLYDDTYDRFLGLIGKEKARVFEIGCGPGNITRYLLGKRPDLHIDAIDIAPTMIDLAKQNVPGVSFRVLDARDIGQVADRYDALMCGFALPYLSKEDSEKLFTDAAALLVKGGVAYFSAIEGEYSQSGYETASSGDACYVYYYGETDLSEALKKAGFKVADVMRKKYPKGEGTTTDLILLVQKH